jgi:hypothetical protein
MPATEPPHRDGPGAGREAMPVSCALIEVHVGELKQLFNAMDPAPFRDRDLDPNAEEFIVDWSREVEGDRPLALVVHLSREPARPGDAAVLQQAVHEFFAHRAEGERRRLKRLLRLGRTSLLIAVVFLGAALTLGDLVVSLVGDGDFGELLRESLLVGGAVALWRPLEIFLYDWWPIRDEARLYDRLSAMSVRMVDAAPAADAAGRPLGARPAG